MPHWDIIIIDCVFHRATSHKTYFLKLNWGLTENHTYKYMVLGFTIYNVFDYDFLESQ